MSDATNYISDQTVKILVKQNDSVKEVKEVENQQVRLANGERE